MSASIFPYFLGLGVRHLRRNPVLTALIVLTIGVGVAASMSTLTILHAMSGDPIPHKSDRLFVPLLDIRPDDENREARDAEPPVMVTHRDAVGLKAAAKGKRQTAIYGVRPPIDSGRPDLPPFFAEGLAVHADFFPMFDVPFVAGGPWSAEDDERGARVVVIRAALASRLFGDADPIGKTIRLGDQDHAVSGVIADDWQPLPKYYRLVGTNTYGAHEDTFLPFTTAVQQQLEPNGSVSCHSDSGTGFTGMRDSECVWILFWVELASAGDAPAYRDFLAAYTAEQRKLGRFPLPDNHRLYDVRQWLDVRRVVHDDARLQTYLAFGFLLVCLVNTIGLLLAKYTARAGEIGVRRALGAGRRAVFAQYLIETAVVGLVGGLAGLGLTQAALAVLGSRSKELHALAQMDWQMFATTFALAIGATVVAGLLPIWRACQVRPALQLKSQ